MINLRMGFSSGNQESNYKHGIMDDVGDDFGKFDSGSSDSSEVFSVESSESELMDDEATSSASSASPPPAAAASSSPGQVLENSPLHDMSSLMHQLPLKRGLSNYFQGKSQSFTSLSNARSLEDLAKPENPYNKKLKSCKSYGGLSLSTNHSHTSSSSSSSSHHLPRTNSSSRFITKRASNNNSRASCSLLINGAKRTSPPSFVGNRPPVIIPSPPPPPPPPHGHGSMRNISNHQTPLFV